MFALYALLFLLSGAAALMAQLVWSRQLAFIVGASAPAVALVLTLFMLGLALGAKWGGSRAATLRNPLRAFALLEAGGGLWALLSIKLSALLLLAYQALGGGYPVRLMVAALLVLPAALLWGAGLPLLASVWAAKRGEAEMTTGILYGINTCGAALGAFLAAYVLLPALGFKATLLIAALIDVAVGLVAWGVGWKDNAPAPTPTAAEAEKLPRRWMAALLLLGFASFAIEVILTRVFILQWSSAVYAFAAVLIIVLIGTALGGFVGGGLASRYGGDRVLGGCLALAGLGAPWMIFQFASINDFTLMMARFFKPDTPLREGLMLLAVAAPIVLPGAVLAGTAIPALTRRPAGAGADLGWIYFFNTLGNVLGAACTGFFLIPRIGVQNTLYLCSFLYLAASVLIAIRFEKPGRENMQLVRWPLLAGAGLLASFLLTPAHTLITSSVIFKTDTYTHLVLEEGVNGTALLSIVNQAPDRFLSLEVNGINVAGTTPDNYSIQKLQGHLPLFFHPDPKEILHIGVGSGGTAYSVSTHPVESITIAEIAPEVKQLAQKYFTSTNHGVFDDPRVKFDFNDGRNVLLASPKAYDAILSDSVHPRLAGNGSLYTAEYFRLLKSRLNNGGVASMWLPAYTLRPQDFQAIVAAFCGVFDPANGGDVALIYNHATMNQFTVVIGRNGGPLQMDLNRFNRLLERPALKADLAAIGRARPEAFFSDYIAGGRTLCDWAVKAPPMTDDRLQSEYLSGVWSIPRHESWWASFTAFHALRESPWPRVIGAPPEFAAVFEAEWRAAGHNLDGQRLAGQAGMQTARGDAAGAEKSYAEAQAAFDLGWAASPQMAEPVDITRRYEFPRQPPPDILALPPLRGH